MPLTGRKKNYWHRSTLWEEKTCGWRKQGISWNKKNQVKHGASHTPDNRKSHALLT